MGKTAEKVRHYFTFFRPLARGLKRVGGRPLCFHYWEYFWEGLYRCQKCGGKKEEKETPLPISGRLSNWERALRRRRSGSLKSK